MRTALAHPLDLPLYDLGEDHPMSTVRYRLAFELIRAYGLLERDDVEVLAPRPATVDEITRVHAPAYVKAIRRYSDDPALGLEWEARQWGLTPGGAPPPVPGLHDRAASVCGVAMAAATAVWEGRADRALAIGGGLHHAFANRAAGFCVYNDPAVAIQALLDAGAERVAFVDVDAHHGDGTQVVAPAVLAFRPDVLVLEPGWDGYHADVLTHLQITVDGFRRVHRMVGELAQEATGGRIVAIGGGGYTGDILARSTALLFAEMLGVELPDELPPEWVALARELTGAEPTRSLYGDVPFDVPEDRRAGADARANEVVDAARALVGRR